MHNCFYYLHCVFYIRLVCVFIFVLSGCCIPFVPLSSLPDLLLLPTNDFSLGLGGVLNGWHPHHPSDCPPKVTLVDTSPRRRKKTVRFDGPQTKDSGIDTSSTFTSSEDSNSAPKVLGASLW